MNVATLIVLLADAGFSLEHVEKGGSFRTPTRDETAALDTIVENIMRDGGMDALSEIDRTALPAPFTPDSLDALEWAKAFGSGSNVRMLVSPGYMAAWFALAIEAGRQANKVRGLNGDDDGVALDQPEANAVVLTLDGHAITLNVDGRDRVKIADANMVQLVWDGNRDVLVDPDTLAGYDVTDADVGVT